LNIYRFQYTPCKHHSSSKWETFTAPLNGYDCPTPCSS